MKYYIYDFDGTIYDGNSCKDIIIYAIKKYPANFFIIVYNLFLYILKIIDKQKFKSNIFSFLKNIDNIDNFVSEFWRKHEKKLKLFWLDKKTHKEDIIISESGSFWLNYIVEKYKIGDIFASEYDLKTGKTLTNEYSIEENINKFYNKYPKAKNVVLYTAKENLIKPNNIKEMFLVRKNKIISYDNYKHSSIKKIIHYINKIFNNREIFCYIVAGILTVLVNLVTKWLLLLTIFNEKNVFELQFTVIFSWIVAVVFAYFINRIYVFRSSNNKKISEFVLFLSSRIFTLVLEMFLTWLLITILNMNVTFCFCIIQFIVIIANYILSKLFIFKTKK